MIRRTALAVVLATTTASLLYSPTVFAREIKGENYPETISAGGKTLKLVGVGVRKKLVIDVYLGGLYMETPSKNASEVIASDQCKAIEMRFVYKEVQADQLVEAWNEGFKNNAGNAVSALKDKIARFNGFFTEPMKKGERMTLTYIPGKGVEVSIKGNVRGVIEGADFMKALFSIWFGPKPPSGGLKEGMLGE